MIKTLIFSLFLFLALAPLASAETHTNINVSDNSDNSQSNVSVKSNTGSNTVCINGKCTTTEGESNSKVCVNGQCYESKNGDVDVKAVNGVTTVKINDTAVSSGSSTPTVTPKADASTSSAQNDDDKPDVKGIMTEAKPNWVAIIGTHALNIIKKLFLFSFF